MALCLTNIGRAHRNAKKPLDAEDYFNRALRLRHEWSELEPDNPSARSDLAAAHMLLATLLKTTSRRELAESCYLASIREREQLIQDFPRTVDYRVGLAFALRSLSEFQRMSGRALDAEQSARRGIDVAKVALAEAPTAANARWILATNHQLAALALEKQDRPHAALVEFQASVDVFQKLAADFPEESNYGGNAGWRAYDLARLWRGLGQAREAEQTLRQALACFEKLMAEHGHDPVHGRDFVTVSGTLADVLIAGARPAEAETVLTRARAIAAQLASETKAPAYQKLLAGVHSHLGSFFAKTARYAEAVDAYRSALEAVPKDNAARQQLAWLLATCPVTELRDPATAVRLAREAVAAQPKNGQPWTALGAAQYRNGDWADAVKSLNESVRLQQGENGATGFFLAMSHWRQGDQKAARGAFQKAVAWMQKNDPDSAEFQRLRTEAAALLGIE
jgi:tetratricopeptide (TPR) repeat protein